MAPKRNPKKLNKLQLKTLAILQGFAETDIASPGENDGEFQLSQIPRPHGDHFHVAKGVVMTRDATGLFNRGVWAALERKGLMHSGVFPLRTILTAEGIDYDTGVKEQIIYTSDH
ncbi:MAG: hypothetical protein CMP14_11610 [Rickettsiales bacterium]|nr:hypothetical protein [Rickettsiales bacterium]|tara:strand:- start:3425 stop:3769 length:345 start_codon:yes stop_codon:yes gene_type:complete